MIIADKVFILLQPGHPDTKQKLYTERLKSIPVAKGAAVEFIALDTDGDANAILTKHNLTTGKQHAPDTAYEAARAAAHSNVWQKALQENSKNILILEEGFLPESSHYHILDFAEEEWDMLYLGRDTEEATSRLHKRASYFRAIAMAPLPTCSRAAPLKNWTHPAIGIT